MLPLFMVNKTPFALEITGSGRQCIQHRWIETPSPIVTIANGILFVEPLSQQFCEQLNERAAHFRLSTASVHQDEHLAPGFRPRKREPKPPFFVIPENRCLLRFFARSQLLVPTSRLLLQA
jgi:hypothetical protein